jgi:hypothetical protein
MEVRLVVGLAVAVARTDGAATALSEAADNSSCMKREERQYFEDI